MSMRRKNSQLVSSPVPVSVGAVAAQFAAMVGIDTVTMRAKTKVRGVATVSDRKPSRYAERVPTLTVEKRLADEDSDVMRHVVAHEIAHLALGHPRSSGRDQVITGVLLLAAAPVGVVQPFMPEAVALGMWLVTMVMLVTGALIFAHRQRSREYAADAFAATHFGCPMTTEACERLRKRERWGAWIPRAFVEHPRPRKRLRATQKLSERTTGGDWPASRSATQNG